MKAPAVIGTRILDGEGSVHAVRTADGWASTYAGETFSASDNEAFDRIAAGESDEWPASELNGNRPWVGMTVEGRTPTPPASSSRALIAEICAERFDTLERQLRSALQILSTTRGRAAIDDRGVGMTRTLLEGSLTSVLTIRNESASRANTEAA